MRYMELPEGIETKVFVSDYGALEELPLLLKKEFGGQRPLIIADGNTWRVAGEKAQQLCVEAGLNPYAPFLLPATPKPHPDVAISQRFASEFPEDCVPVAVGSGVINDLVKCASNLVNKRYCCVATACSVDGYTAAGGSMSVNGMKKTVPCPAPLVLVADTGILQTAPRPMMASGYADLMSKVTGGADWIIADVLGIEAIVPHIWRLVQEDLRDRLSDCMNLEKIFAGLAATGYSMQMYHDSRPASGAEHMCSHIWEMEHLSYEGEEVSHGFKVGIGVLAISQLQEFVMKTSAEEARKLAMPALDRAARQQEIEALLARGCYGTGIAEVAMDKTPFGEESVARRELIWQKWPELQKGLARQLIPSSTLRTMLQTAQCPTRFQEIGLDEPQYLHGIRAAQLIRKRYTVLDLLYEAGLFEQAIATIENK